MAKTTKKLNLHLPDEPMLMPTNEIVGAYVTSVFGSEAVEEYVASPQKISETLGLDIAEDVDLHIVQNTEYEVHLALPYYRSFDDVHVAPLSEEDMEAASGGEFFFIILPGILIGAKIASIVGATTIVSATAFSVMVTTTTVVGASAGAIAAGAVIGGAIGAGVAGAVAGAGALIGTAVTTAQSLGSDGLPPAK